MVRKLRDNLFISQPGSEPFEFNENVVRIFDDMLERSVPFYREYFSPYVREDVLS